MKHRDRVLTALNHQQPDRCPMQVSFTPEFAQRLRKEIEQTTTSQHNPNDGGNTYEIERSLDEDMLMTSVGWANWYYQSTESYTDDWEVGWQPIEYETRFGKGHYAQIKGHPLAEDNAIEHYQPPDPTKSELYIEAERVIAEYKDEYWIVGVTVCTIFETAWALRGFERLLTDFVLNPDLASRILDIPYHYHLTAAKKLVELGVDMIWIGDDIGAQNTMIISPNQWRQIFKPRMANFISSLKQINPEVKVAYHSDGNIYEIIPDLIEIGLDVLNPVQPACMEPAKLKKEFGDKLCFWGTIDEQNTLPFGTPEDVEREIVTRLKTVGKGGDLIIGPTHHVQLDTPMENFWSMVNTITKTPYSSLR